MGFDNIPAGLYVIYGKRPELKKKEAVMIDHYLNDFKKQIHEKVLNDFFETMRQSKQKKSYRYTLQVTVRKLWLEYYRFCVDIVDGALVINPDKHITVSELFYETMDMITGHPKFSWELNKSEKIPKANSIALNSVRYVNLLIKDSQNDLRKGIQNLIEGTR